MNVIQASVIAMPSVSTLLEVSTVNAKKVRLYPLSVTRRQFETCQILYPDSPDRWDQEICTGAFGGHLFLDLTGNGSSKWPGSTTKIYV